MKAIKLLAAAGLLTLVSGVTVFAASKATIDADVADALTRFHKLNVTHEQLEQRALGVLIFPGVTKAGMGVAGEHGEGVLQVNGSTVGYYSLTSASVGLTLGIAKHAKVILFMTEQSLADFNKNKGWSIGVDTGIAIAKLGAGGNYDSVTLKKSIVGFVFSEKGLMADVSLDGSKISRIYPQ